MATTGADAVKALVSDFKDMKLEKIPEERAQAQVKESKGFRRLLKFGKKNHSTGAGDRNPESDNGSTNGSEADEFASNAASSSEGNLNPSYPAIVNYGTEFIFLHPITVIP